MEVWWKSHRSPEGQRGLTTPLIKRGDRFVASTWEDAFAAIEEGLKSTGAKGNEIKAVAGDLADTESMVALKDLVNRLGSDNLALDHVGGDKPPVHGVDIRSSYLFNSTIPGVEEADARNGHVADGRVGDHRHRQYAARQAGLGRLEKAGGQRGLLDLGQIDAVQGVAGLDPQVDFQVVGQ